MRQLPVMDAYAHALRSTSNNIAFAWHVSWPWMAILFPIVLLVNGYAFLKLGGNPMTLESDTGALGSVVGIVNAIAFSSIAVNWHRYILLDEVPHGAHRLRLDATVWRYFGNTLLIFIVLIVVGLIIGTILGLLAALLGNVGYFLAAIGIAALVLVGISAFYRLGIKLPAVALYRRDFQLMDAWRASEGNGWRVLGLALLYFLTAIAAGLAFWIVGAIVGIVGGIPALALLVAMQMVVSWVLTILGVTLLTSLYGFFVEGRSF